MNETKVIECHEQARKMALSEGFNLRILREDPPLYELREYKNGRNYEFNSINELYFFLFGFTERSSIYDMNV